MKAPSLAAFTCLALTLPAAALAQPAQPTAPTAPEAEEAVEVEEVVVTAARPRGAVVADIPPEVTLNEEDIQAYGAATLSELLEQLAPQISSGRGRGDGQPVTLLNGRRISGFGEIRGIPPEALERVEVLPEEVALRYGFRADQRVVNFVTRPSYRSLAIQAELGGSTAGGRPERELDVNGLNLTRTGRQAFDLDLESQDALLESERSLTQSRPLGLPASDATDVGAFRTLLGRSESATLNGTVNRILPRDISATVNAQLSVTEGENLQGLDTGVFTLPAGGPFSPGGQQVVTRYLDALGALRRDSETTSGRLGVAFDGRISDWRWSLTGAYDRALSTTESDVGADVAALQARAAAGDPSFNPFNPIDRAALSLLPRDRAESDRQTVNAELTTNGTLLTLPAGELQLTASAEVEALSFESESRRSGVEASADLSRDRGAFAGNLDLPIAERDGSLGFLGDLSANANLEVEELSDFGRLLTVGYGLNWSPRERLDLVASITEEDGAPTVNQLGDPLTTTVGVPTFDFTRGETVDVIRLSGGNPGLVADSRRVLKLGANWRPWDGRNLNLSFNYLRTRIEDPISAFPSATAEIEAAFPDRFVRDATGRLIRVDSRPVNFARLDREEVRYGFNWFTPIGPQPARATGPGGAGPRGGGGGVRVGGPPGGRGGGRGGRGPGGFGGGGGPGGFGGAGPGGGPPQGARLQLSLYHTIRLTDEILIREGVPVLDLLNGSATGASGGQSRHTVNLQAGLFRNGLGARLDAAYQSGTRVDGVAGRSTDLDFSELLTVNARLFADLGQQRELVQARPWLRGVRLGFSVYNLFDERIDVRDPAGLIPISFEADRIDPLGRTVRFTVRKLFSPPPPARPLPAAGRRRPGAGAAPAQPAPATQP